jgi:hypothetical protein
MPYVDTSEMWQNMFDMTEVHPNQGSNTKDPIPGANTNLQKVCDIRYKSFFTIIYLLVHNILLWLLKSTL